MTIDKQHEAAVDAYLAKLKAVLMTPDHGDGSWPDIPTERLHEMDGLVEEMLSLKWGEDCDGDKPVRFSMFYRRTHRLVWDSPLRLDRDGETAEAESRRLLGNLSSITGAIGSYNDELQHIEQRLDELARREACIAATFPVWQVRYSKPENWLASENKHDQPASLHLSEEAAAAFVPPAGFEKGKTVRRWAVPDTYASPTDNFAEYRAKVAGASEAVVPQFGVLEKLHLENRDPR